jgi:hypothetical protein
MLQWMKLNMPMNNFRLPGKQDADFLAELEAHAVGMPIMFIPMIKHGIMNVATFREALRQQHEFAINTISMSIKGVAGLEVETECNGEKVTLAKMILNLKDDKGKVLFSGIEQTKFTNEYRHYLVLTQKNVIDVAEAKFDELLLNLANEGKLDAFCIEGTFICFAVRIKFSLTPWHPTPRNSKLSFSLQWPLSTLNPTVLQLH